MVRVGVRVRVSLGLIRVRVRVKVRGKKILLSFYQNLVRPYIVPKGLPLF